MVYNANMDIRDKFWSRVDIRSSLDCWEWQAGKTRKGYGDFYAGIRNGKPLYLRAHRVSWELVNGEIPEGLHVLHHCDNPPCVNPAHLWLGSNADNVADKMAKGRHNGGGPGKGVKHHFAKLTDSDVIAIRKLYATGEYSYIRLGAMFNTEMGNVGRIVRRDTWKHI